MRKKIFATLAAVAERRPWLMIGAAMIVTLIAGGLAEQLKLEMQFKNLMPQQHPTVQEYDRIVDTFTAASNIIIAARGEERVLKGFAEEMVPQLRAMTDYIRRVDYKLNQEFFSRYGFMLAKTKDLENMGDQFTDLGLVPFLTHLNDAFEKTYVADGESISNQEKEDKAVQSLDGIQYLLNTMQAYVEQGDELGADRARETVDRFLVGDPYFISQDKDMLLIIAHPTFTVNEIDLTVDAINAIDALIAEVSTAYPGLDAGTTGTMALARDEMVAASEDMYVSSILAFILIILLFILSFRMWSAPLLAGISLVIGVVWAAGFATLTIGSLNIMTSMFAVVLIGLGIDFNIHIISAYNENRASGLSVRDAMEEALTKVGNGVVIGAASTALAFLTMLVSENAGMKEFGLISGSGVLFCMLAAILVLPSLLVIRDRLMQRIRKDRFVTKSTEFVFLGKTALILEKRPFWVLSAALVLTAFLLYEALNIQFNYNYLDLEPKGLKSIELQDWMIEEFDITPDMVLVTSSSVEEARQIAQAAKDLGSVGMVMTISDYVPSEEEQEDRRPFIQKLKSDLDENNSVEQLTADTFDRLIDELYRVEDNVIELAQLAFAGGQDKVDRKTQAIVGDLEQNANERESMVVELVEALQADPEEGIYRLGGFQDYYEPYLRQTARGMMSEETIVIGDLPEDIQDQFMSYDGRHFLLSIYPKEQVWDISFLGRFTEQMHSIDPRVTGMPLIFYVLIDYIGKDGRLAAILTLIAVFFLLLVDFRDLRLALLAMLPLIVGAIWMVGIMNLVGMKLDIVNVIGIPLILGIGIDDGVHVLHRFKIEGFGRLDTVFSSTGKAVLLTTLTTMLAFGSLATAVYRGLVSLGLTLFIGVGAAFVTTIVILPPLLGLISKTKLSRSIKK